MANIFEQALERACALAATVDPDDRVYVDGEWLAPAEALRRSSARSRQRSHERLRQSGCSVTDEVLDRLDASGLQPTAASKAIGDWWTSRGKPWLVLAGATGIGKSVACAEQLYTFGGLFVRADEIVRVFSTMFGEQYAQQRKIRSADLLVLDEIGGELDSTRMLPALLDLLETRKSARSTPTVVTTNLSKNEFAARYASDRLMSRMSELVQWEAVGGEDFRRANKLRSA